MEITDAALAQMRTEISRRPSNYDFVVHVYYGETQRDLIRNSETGKGEWVVVIPEGYQVHVIPKDKPEIIRLQGDLITHCGVEILDGIKDGLMLLDFSGGCWIVNGEKAVKYKGPKW